MDGEMGRRKGQDELGRDLGGWIDERKGMTRLGERRGKRPGAGLVYVDEGVAKISIDLVTGYLAPAILRREK
jgi:hypothetical protein